MLKRNKIETKIAYGNISAAIFSENYSIDWFGPILLFTATAITQNEKLVSITLNIISSYLYDTFKSKKEDPTLRCSFVYSSTKKTKKISYEGPISGLKEIESVIKDLRYE
ncbi:hypothetical protein [Leptospira noguchii]|uniref:hypothetical protein n=1 Tax=Leptospira noguchii TaxID=28182 RepID=UPI0006923C0A|nr:hypothetical protein [Leptospira noguchii]